MPSFIRINKKKYSYITKSWLPLSSSSTSTIQRIQQPLLCHTQPPYWELLFQDMLRSFHYVHLKGKEHAFLTPPLTLYTTQPHVQRLSEHLHHPHTPPSRFAGRLLSSLQTPPPLLYHQPHPTPSPFTLFLSLVCFLRCRHNHRRTTKERKYVSVVTWINISKVKLNNSLLLCFQLKIISSKLKFVINIFKMHIFIAVGLVLLQLFLCQSVLRKCLWKL